MFRSARTSPTMEEPTAWGGSSSGKRSFSALAASTTSPAEGSSIHSDATSPLATSTALCTMISDSSCRSMVELNALLRSCRFVRRWMPHEALDPCHGFRGVRPLAEEKRQQPHHQTIRLQRNGDAGLRPGGKL